MIPFKQGIHELHPFQFHIHGWIGKFQIPNHQGSVATTALASSMSSVEVVNENAFDTAKPKSQEKVCMKWDMREEGGKKEWSGI